LNLDRKGIPAIGIYSEEFRSGVEAWREMHGFDAGAIYVRHPIQPLTEEEIHGRADEVFDEVIAAITGQG